jgi:redox-sensitive bicupin YhaK (pirin superfamily)
MNAKKVSAIQRATGSHWVGDGFPVNTLLSYNTMGASISPFLLLDYAGPAKFEPSTQQRGVGMHPHRGFETVTIVYQGEVEHKDNAGNSGKIGPGDVQWMTAARGILHEELHSKAFTRQGGMLEMIQLWVNLPAKDKMSVPHYQEILNADIPVKNLPDQAGTVRIIAGQFGDIAGAARTHTPINLWDIRLFANRNVDLVLPDGTNTALLVLEGAITINGTEALTSKELALFDSKGAHISLQAREDAVLLIMNGEPIDEPIAGYGPFVMNTDAEINQAVKDFNTGRF